MNGVAERLNRTLVSKVRAMLKDARLPKSFWGEAVKSAVYLKNLTPTKSKKFEVPEHIWSQVKPHVGHLRVFGSKAYVRHTKPQGKLEDKSRECIFVGYENNGRVYRLIEKGTNKVVKAAPQDVMFLEDAHKINLELPEESPLMVEGVGDLGGDEEHEGDEEGPSDGAHEGGDAGSSTPTSNPPLMTYERRQPTPSKPPPRRSARLALKSRHQDAQAKVVSVDEPLSFKQAMASEDHVVWRKAMEEELRALEERGVGVLVEKPRDAPIVDNKWVYRIKRKADGSI